MRRSSWTVTVLVAATSGVALLLRPGSRAHKAACRAWGRLGRRVRYLEGRLEGAAYRARGGHPDPDVVDSILADRVRTSLGPLEKELDLPNVHVMAEHHVVLLHGEVGSEENARALEKTAAAVEGVDGVESYLHVGLGAGDTRPSAGHAAHHASAARATLLDAAREAGVTPELAPIVVRGVLATFADRLPAAQRERLASHLPDDVLPLMLPPRRIAHARPPRTVHDLVGRIAVTTAGLPLERSGQVTAAVLHALARLVPDDDADVGAVLPPELRSLWEGAEVS